MANRRLFVQNKIYPTGLQRFESELSGRLLFPHSSEYDDARKIWNGMIDKHPAMIVKCANHTDVSSAIRFARDTNIEVSVRGGGHNVAGTALCDDGLVIDLADMKEITIDPVKRTTRAQAGLTLGEFITATSKYGLATTTGIVSDTGMSGLTLGGGIGWLMGKYGLAVDNLLSVEIVTADGELLTASPTEIAELFWGGRGGGGNFGIVTTFEFQLHPVQQVLAGLVGYPITAIKEVLQFYREFSASSPDELTLYVAIITTPRGIPLINIAACYCGDLQEGERVLAPLRAFRPPLFDTIAPTEYLDFIQIFDAENPRGLNYYEKDSSLPTLSDEAIAIIIEHAMQRTSSHSQVIIQHIHGYASRVDSTATAAYALRGEQYLVAIDATWKEPNSPEQETHIQWARKFWSALEPYASKKAYINTLNAGDERLRASYGPVYDRLVALKDRYDPTNFFHHNQNIRPSQPVSGKSV
jgi:FAD/FMN-containing dehydrogenase